MVAGIFIAGIIAYLYYRYSWQNYIDDEQTRGIIEIRDRIKALDQHCVEVDQQLQDFRHDNCRLRQNHTDLEKRFDDTEGFLDAQRNHNCD